MKKVLILALSLSTGPLLAGWQDNVNTWFANSKGTISSLLSKCASGYTNQVKPTAQGLWQQAEPYKYYIAGAGAALGMGYLVYNKFIRSLSLSEWETDELKRFRDLCNAKQEGVTTHTHEAVNRFNRDGNSIVVRLFFNSENNTVIKEVTAANGVSLEHLKSTIDGFENIINTKCGIH